MLIHLEQVFLLPIMCVRRCKRHSGHSEKEVKIQGRQPGTGYCEVMRIVSRGPFANYIEVGKLRLL